MNFSIYLLDFPKNWSTNLCQQTFLHRPDDDARFDAFFVNVLEKLQNYTAEQTKKLTSESKITRI